MRKPEFLSRRSYALVLLPVAVVAAYFAWAFLGQMLKGRELALEVQSQIETNRSLQQKQAELKAKLQYYESGGYEVMAEKRAREELNMAREGDIVLLPVYSDTVSASGQTAEPSAAPSPAAQESLFDRLEHLFQP